jgi:hypothetical protein
MINAKAKSHVELMLGTQNARNLYFYQSVHTSLSRVLTQDVDCHARVAGGDSSSSTIHCMACKELLKESLSLHLDVSHSGKFICVLNPRFISDCPLFGCWLQWQHVQVLRKNAACSQSR